MTERHAARLRDHWWPRPGWWPGQIVLTWHLVFPDAPDLHRLVGAYHRALDGLPGLNPVAPQLLHLTVQRVGHAEELTACDLDAVTAAVGRELAGFAPFTLTFDRPIVFGEAIALRPEPIEPLHALQVAMQRGIADALRVEPPDDGLPERTWRPHVSIAYCHADLDATPHAAALAAADPAPATVTVDRVAFIRQERQLHPHWRYRWDLQATAPLGIDGRDAG